MSNCPPKGPGRNALCQCPLPIPQSHAMHLFQIKLFPFSYKNNDILLHNFPASPHGDIESHFGSSSRNKAGNSKDRSKIVGFLLVSVTVGAETLCCPPFPATTQAGMCDQSDIFPNAPVYACANLFLRSIVPIREMGGNVESRFTLSAS